MPSPRSRAELAGGLKKLRKALNADGMIWISWPKKAAGVPTDVTEDVVRAEALKLDLVDVKVAAIDNMWSGLKLVVRLANRCIRGRDRCAVARMVISMTDRAREIP